MERKNIFFDADGTILDIEKGVPADTADALFQLKQNGHRMDALKAEADLVTDPLWEGGVPNALRKLGLI